MTFPVSGRIRALAAGFGMALLTVIGVGTAIARGIFPGDLLARMEPVRAVAAEIWIRSSRTAGSSLL